MPQRRDSSVFRTTQYPRILRWDRCAFEEMALPEVPRTALR